MATTTTPLTIDDYERLPQEVAERHELVDGALVEVPGNNPEHGETQGLLVSRMLPFVRERRLGKVLMGQGYDFNGNVHGPDLSFFLNAKFPMLQWKKRVQRFVPDLAIEIVSPWDTWDSLTSKKDRYRRCGTQEVWIVSLQSREVYIYSDRGSRVLDANSELSTPLIPGFQIAVKDLFEQE